MKTIKLNGTDTPQSLRSIPACSVIAEEVNSSDSGTQNVKNPQQLLSVILPWYYHGDQY